MRENNKREFYLELGFAIYEARRKKDFSQEMLAQKVGLSRASIVNIEKGRQNPPLHLLWMIAKELDTDVATLIPDFSLDENELKPSLQQIIRKKEKEGQFNDDSLKKMYSFLSKSLG